MDYATKLVYQSNYWYNDGLKKANIRDLSGAIVSLRRSLQYSRSNIAARNLLGLVYYGRGDVGEALVEWILSKNFQSHDNIANYYIQKTRENTAELDMINQAIKKYNQALGYARQNGEDLAIIQLKKAVDAHPSFVKAYQLLALLYLHTEQYSAARQAIRAAHKLDKTDDVTLRYMHELNQIRKSRTVKIKEKDKKDQQTVTYSIGNETIIQPVSTGYKESAGLHTIANIAVGLVVGVAVMWFLIMPAVNKSRQDQTNQDIVAFSDQIAEQEAQISALQTELETYRSTSQETENAQATATATQESYEIVMNISDHYYAGDMGSQAMVEELLKVNPDSLGTVGRGTFDEMTETLYPQVCSSLYAAAQESYDVANYETAITNLEQVMQMDESYNDGAAMLLLAQAYQGSGDQDQANVYYQRIIENYADTDAAQSAQEALDEQNGASADDSSDSGDGDSQDTSSGDSSEEN
nr:tetratricopeptide repeat protein [uncultured Merdimonas sp.]